MGVIYYGVKKGKVPGVYDDKHDALLQVEGEKGWEMRKFKTKEEAIIYVFGGKGLSVQEVTKKRKKKKKKKSSASKSGNKVKTPEKKEEPAEKKLPENTDEVLEEVTAYSDGSWKNGTCGWGVLFIAGGEITELCGSFIEPGEENFCCVAGEIRAAKEAIRLALRYKAKKLVLYYDFEGVARYTECRRDRLKGSPLEYRGFVECAKESMEIEFIKVKSHSGDKGNNRADALAKRGLNMEPPEEM